MLFSDKDNIGTAAKSSQFTDGIFRDARLISISHVWMNFMMTFLTKWNDVISLISSSILQRNHVMSMSGSIYEATPADTIFRKGETLVFMPVEGISTLTHIVKRQCRGHTPRFALKVLQSMFRNNAMKPTGKSPGFLRRCHNRNATIKTRNDQVRLTAPGCEAQLLEKHELRKQREQSCESIANLQAKSDRHSHATSFQRPPMYSHRGLVALSATCAHMSRNALLKLLPTPPIKRRFVQFTSVGEN